MVVILVMTDAGPIAWVAGLPLSRVPLELELAVRTGESAGADPFVTTGMGRFARAHLARVDVLGALTKRFAVKVQRHNWKPPGAGGHGARIDNAELDAMWERERENARAAAGGPVAAIAELFAEELPTTLFCRESEQLFRPLSPAGGPLALCRDDDLLRDCGLEPYSSSTVRYLYSPEAKDRIFYTWSTDSGAGARDGTIVRRQAELFEDLKRAGVGPSSSTDSWVPLFYYPTPALVTEMVEETLTEWCDQLGGAVPTVASSGPAFFHGGNPTALLGEAFHLKLIACEQVAAAVQRFHATTGRPHLGIAPESFAVRLGASAGAPSCWQFEVLLADFGASHRFVPPGDAGAAELLVPTADAPQSYASPFVDPAKFAQEANMSLTVSAASEVGGRQTLTIVAEARGSRVQGPEPGDVVAVDAHGALPGLDDRTLAGVVQKVHPGGAELRVTLAPGCGFPVGSVPFSCSGSVAFYRRYQAPCDLFGLGLTLLRVLLVHDERGLLAVEDAVRAVLEKLSLAVSGVEEPDRSYVVTTLDNLFDDVGFGVWSVLHRKPDRDALREFVVPAALERIFCDTLLAVFRLLAPQPQFGLAAHHGGLDPEHPGALVADVVADLQKLVRRSQVELLGAEVRGREIGAVCDSLLAEINADLYDDGEDS